MFFKNTGNFDSFIGIHSVFNGDVKIQGTLKIDGTMEGNVTADCVVLGETASFKGDIVAACIIVGGKVEGNLIARETVEIKSKGKVVGDVTTNKLLVVDGGVLSGKSPVVDDASQIVELQKREE